MHGWDIYGWTGWDGVSKGSFKFSLFEYLHDANVYSYIYIYSKIFTKILMGFIMPGVVIKNFKIKVDR